MRDELRRTRPCEAVADLSRWTSLRLRDAGLERLRGEDLLQLSNLLLLDLSGNRLPAFPAAALAALPNLWSLQLRGNRLTALPGGAFAGLGHCGRCGWTATPCRRCRRGCSRASVPWRNYTCTATRAPR